MLVEAKGVQKRKSEKDESKGQITTTKGDADSSYWEGQDSSSDEEAGLDDVKAIVDNVLGADHLMGVMRDA